MDGYHQTYSNTAIGGALATILLPSGHAVWNNSASVNYLARWVAHGAFTQPDTCAPVPGMCQGGSTPGVACSSANAVYSSGSLSTPCPGGGTCSLTTEVVNNTITNPNYGVTYGPNGAGGCIQDTNPNDGIGRFPNLHYAGHGNGYGSAFANAMWSLYYQPINPQTGNEPTGPPIVINANNCNENDYGYDIFNSGSVNGSFWWTNVTGSNVSYAGAFTDVCATTYTPYERSCGSSISALIPFSRNIVW